MVGKRKQTIRTEEAGVEEEHELSSTGNPSNFVTRDDIDGVVKDLTKDLTSRLEQQEEHFRRQEASMATLLARLDGLTRQSGQGNIAGTSASVPQGLARDLGAIPEEQPRVDTDPQATNRSARLGGNTPNPIQASAQVIANQASGSVTGNAAQAPTRATLETGAPAVPNLGFMNTEAPQARVEPDILLGARLLDNLGLDTGGIDANLPNQNPFLGMGTENQIADAIRRYARGGASHTNLESITRSPLSSGIRNSRNPPDFKLPVLESYDGRKDPTAHLTRYIRHMEVLSASEDVMAKCFSFFLTDIAAMWYRQLEADSITSWNDLLTRFVEQFRVNIVRPKSVMTLNSIKQKPSETLRKFLKRFNAAVASVDKADPSMVLMAAVSGVLDKSEFKTSLHRDPPRDLGEFYFEAERFLREEDARADSSKKVVDDKDVK